MHCRDWTAFASLVVLGGAALWGALGCDSAAARRRELCSGNPLDRARGVIGVSEGRDAVAVHKLVDLLEDSDKAVRMYAIVALRRLCGRDYGYRYYASGPERAAAAQRWRAALRAGEVVLQPAAAADDDAASNSNAPSAPKPAPDGAAAAESRMP